MQIFVLGLYFVVLFYPFKKNKVVILAIYINSKQRAQGLSYTASVFRFLRLREAIYHGDAASKCWATENTKTDIIWYERI